MLTITGDIGANELNVSSTDVEGTRYLLVADGATTLLDGRPTAQNIAAGSVMSIYADAGEGNDTVRLAEVSAENGFASITTVILGGGGDDTLTGSSFTDFITGATGNDTLIGGGGDDLYSFTDSGNGSDAVIEEEAGGRDWLDFSLSALPVWLCLSESSPQDWGGGSLTLSDPHQVENIVGSIYDDYLCLNESGNIAYGLEGLDKIVAGGGNDYLFGGPGGDQILGGSGRDILVGGSDVDLLSGDADDDLLIEGDLEFVEAQVENFADFVAIHDAVLAAWTAELTLAERIANLTGAPGATDPLPSELQLHPGVTVFGDESLDLLAAALGEDLVYLDSRVDTALLKEDDQATFIELDPEIQVLWAEFDDGLLTVSYRGGGDLVYSVEDGVLKVNGADLLQSPILVGDVLNVVTQLGPLAGALDDAVLLSGTLPNIQSVAYTRGSRSEMPTYTAQDVDAILTAQLGPDWTELVELTAEEIADIYNSGHYGIIWEVACVPSGSSSSMSLQAGEMPWYDIADSRAALGGAILSESSSINTMSSSSGGEGGTLDIQDTEAPEGGWAEFTVTFNAEYFNGCSVQFHTEDATGYAGVDYQATSGTLTWLDGHEGDGGFSVRTYNDGSTGPVKTFKAVLTDIQNEVGPSGNMSIGANTGIAHINEPPVFDQVAYALSHNLDDAQPVGTPPFTLGQAIGQVHATDLDDAPIYSMEPSSFFSIDSASGVITITNPVDLEEYFETTDSISIAVYANDGINPTASAFCSFGKFAQGVISNSYIKLTDSTGTVYRPTTAAQLITDLQTLQTNGTKIDELIIKGHGGYEFGLQVGTGNAYMTCEGGVIDIDGTDVTQLFINVTDGNSDIYFTGCHTMPFAQKVSDVLHPITGARLYGINVYISGIPGTPFYIPWPF